MNTISEIRVSSHQATPTVVVRGAESDYEGLREFFDSAFGTLGSLMQGGNLSPTGPAPPLPSTAAHPQGRWT